MGELTAIYALYLKCRLNSINGYLEGIFPYRFRTSLVAKGQYPLKPLVYMVLPRGFEPLFPA